MQAQQEVEELKHNLEEFLSSKDKMYEKFYPHILEISLEIAKKIIKKEVELSEDILKEIIMSALDEINQDALSAMN